MKGEKITQVLDIIQYIKRRGAENKLAISEIERMAGISLGGISRWKWRDYDYGPRFIKVLEILKILNSCCFIKKDGEIINRINNQQELMAVIIGVIEAEQISKIDVEKNVGISQGRLSRWNKSSYKNKVGIVMTIKLLTYLGCEIIFARLEDLDGNLNELPRFGADITGSEDEQYLEQLVVHFPTMESSYFEHLCNFIISNTTRQEKGEIIKRLTEEIIKR